MQTQQQLKNMESKLTQYLDEMSPGVPGNINIDEISELPSLGMVKANTIGTLNFDPKAAQKAIANK